jgi:hypothetical protein
MPSTFSSLTSVDIVLSFPSFTTPGPFYLISNKKRVVRLQVAMLQKSFLFPECTPCKKTFSLGSVGSRTWYCITSWWLPFILQLFYDSPASLQGFSLLWIVSFGFVIPLLPTFQKIDLFVGNFSTCTMIIIEIRLRSLKLAGWSSYS